MVCDDAGYSKCGSRTYIERGFQLELRSMIIKQARQHGTDNRNGCGYGLDCDSVISISIDSRRDDNH